MNRKPSYRVLIMVVISHALGHLQTGVMPVLFPSIMEEFQLGYFHIGLIRTASSFATGFPQLFVSFLRRRFLGNVLLGIGNIVLSVMNALSSLAKSLNQFLVYRVIGGVGGSPQHPIGASIIAKNFQEQRGRAMGFNLVGSNLASVLAPLIGTLVLVSLGWRTAIFICTLPSFCLGLAFLFLVKEREEMNEKPKGTLSVGAFLHAMRDKNVLAVSLVRTALAFRMGIRAFIPTYFIRELTMDPTQASFLFSLMLVGGVIGPFLWGYVSDRFGKKLILIFILACSSILFCSLSFIKYTILLAIVLLFIGLMSQAVVVQTILAEVADPAFLDEIFGLYFTLGFTLGSISSILFGYVVEIFGFSSAFIYISLVTAISIVPALFISKRG